MKRLKVGSLFSGIGGLELAAEDAGFEVVWQSEIEPFQSKVLAKHWPHVPNLGDITKIDWTEVERPDLVCGGFPCQDISTANTSSARQGLKGKKSGRGAEFARCIEATTPSWVMVENVVPWHDWVPQVRADLARHGYTTMSVEVPAGAVGAPHIRRRIFVVGNSDPTGEPVDALYAKALRLSPVARPGAGWPEPPPPAFRVDDGVPRRLDRNRALGNSVVPQAARVVTKMIAEVDAEMRAL